MQLPDRSGVQGPYRPLGAFQRGQDRVAGGGQGDARGGEAQSAPVPFDEGGSGLGLQRPQLLGDGGG